MITILGVETSCDETGVAIYNEQGLQGHKLYSQAQMHSEYGGVVPELASRDHVRKLPALVADLCQETSIRLADLSAVAYTSGPGLAGALMVGAGYSCGLATALQVPVIKVHHLEAHVLAVMLEHPEIQFPFLSLLVSGGHTQLIYAKELGCYEIIGDTLDDAIGEAFDKSAKVIGIPYPGGKQLAALAEQGDKNRFPLPRPMLRKAGLEFSFSGLKTAVHQTWLSCNQTAQDKADLAASFQAAVVDTCIAKISRAINTVETDVLVVGGGVAANHMLRSELYTLANKMQFQVYFPRLEFCTDNGAMIAYSGFLHYKKDNGEPNQEVTVRPRWPLGEL